MVLIIPVSSINNNTGFISTNHSIHSISSLFQRSNLPGIGAGVDCSGAINAIVLALFEDVGEPAGNTGRGKDGGEEFGGYVEEIVDCTGEEIDIGVYIPAFLFHVLAGYAFNGFENAGGTVPALFT